MRNKGKLILLAAIVMAVLGFFIFGLGQYLSLETLKAQQQALTEAIAANPFLASAAYLMGYIIITALSLPGATLMTLAGGALFGLVWGLVLVSFASAIGATLAFFASRYLFRDTLRKRYARQLKKIDEGVARDGAFYLASLRLVPIFPFFVINLMMGLTAMRSWTFYWVSQLAMLPGTLVYVNAGTQLAQVESLSGVLSTEVLLSLALLGLFPLLAKIVLAFINRRRLYKGLQRPDRFDYNLLVIGAGSGGLVSAYIGAAVKARVGLIEAHQMGGDCLHTGCVPSKALIKTSRLAQNFRQAERYGLVSMEPEIPFATVMERVQSVIEKVEPHDSVERYSKLGVECISGTARFIDPWTLGVEGASGTQRLTARSIVIATGGRPLLPPIPGIDEVTPLTSENIWQLRERPERLLVLGGGPVGSELAQAFARLGSKVIHIDRGGQLLSKEDPDVGEAVLDQFRRDGIDVRLNHNAARFAVESGQKVLYAEHDNTKVRIEFDEVLVALGRKANTQGLNLEAIQVEPTDKGTLPVAEDMSVRYPHIFACGDVAGPFQFTHTASYQAWFTAVNGLFGHFKRFRVDYSTIPWVTFTSPEVGRVGQSEAEATAQGVDYEVTRYALDDLDRAIAESEDHGFIKVLTAPGKDKILGAVVVGEHAGELLAEFVLAMKHGLGLNKILGTIHVYPTWNEGVKAAAGQWKQAHAPARLLKWLSRYHHFRLGRDGRASNRTTDSSHP